MNPVCDYRLFGLNIRSSIELPIRAGAFPSGGGVDVVVELGAVPDSIPGARLSAPRIHIDPGVLLFAIPGVAKYLVRGGERITVEPVEVGDTRALEVYLMGSAIGALLLQRGLLPLHASAVEVNGACVAFTGGSGAGKSTLAATLADRGHPVICDDVCVVSTDAAGHPLVSPADPRVKLWEDGLSSMQIEMHGLRSVRADTNKYHVPVTGVAGDRVIPLAAVYMLDERGEEREIQPLRGLDAVLALVKQTYRVEFIEPLGLTTRHFSHCTAVARSARIRRLTRPRAFDGIARTLDDLEADWTALRAGGAWARGMHAGQAV